MKFKKRKVTKRRASTFHGWGRGAAHHKGSGNRGGKGRAGSGKRSDGKKPSFWKEPQGKSGFNSKNTFKINAINIEQVEKSLPLWETKGIAVKKASTYEIDLSKTPYNKLLATGTPKFQMVIKVDFASKNAGAKLSETGGKLELLKTIVKKEKKKPSTHKKKEEPAEEAE
jgi:large subunit ribosomal protein L15